MTDWYQHPDRPYLISDDLRVWRQTANGGHLLDPRPGQRITLTHYGHQRNARIADLLEEARRANPDPVPPPTHDPERFLPLPDDPSIEVSNTGNARYTATHDPIDPFLKAGFWRIKAGGHPRRLHNLVAHLHLPDKPPDATHAFFLTSDRRDCSTRNLSWTPPRPIERRTGRRMNPQQTWAIIARSRRPR